MELTRATTYALHALSHLARAGREEPVAVHAVARATGIPAQFLAKVLARLVRAQILLALKGPRGGHRLVRPVEAISLLDVLEAVEGPLRGAAPAIVQGQGFALDRRLNAECEKLAELARTGLRKVSVKSLMGKAK
jgi:Rrf2 family protein